MGIGSLNRQRIERKDNLKLENSMLSLKDYPNLSPEKQQELIAGLLKKSTLTPGKYIPTDKIKNGNHAVICVDNEPILFCGEYGDNETMQQTKLILKSFLAKAVLGGELSLKKISGKDIEWNESGYSSIVRKQSGVIEDGYGRGIMLAFLLGDEKERIGMTVSFCTSNDLAKIFDINCPELSVSLDG